MYHQVELKVKGDWQVICQTCWIQKGLLVEIGITHKPNITTCHMIYQVQRTLLEYFQDYTHGVGIVMATTTTSIYFFGQGKMCASIAQNKLPCVLSFGTID